MTRIGLIIQSVVAALIFVGLLGWWMYRSLRRSEEPVRLIVKWIITALMAPAIFLAGGAGPYGIIFAHARQNEVIHGSRPVASTRTRPS